MLTPYDHPEYRAQIAGIRANPADDLPRLVLADWLEERGEVERAEFIRFQVALDGPKFTTRAGNPRLRRGSAARERCRRLLNEHWREWCSPPSFFLSASCPAVVGGRTMTVEVDGVERDFRRGFVWRVRGPGESVYPVQCGRCEGTGLRTPPPDSRPCRTCDGEGVDYGQLPAIMADHPVTRVDVTGASPHHDTDGWFYWVCEGRGWMRGPDTVPPEVFARLLAHHPDGTGAMRGFASAESALADLSNAILSVCRPRAAAARPAPPVD